MIRKLKSVVEGNTRLYGALFDALTSNADLRRLRRESDQYPSPWGGMWTDRVDFEDQLKKRSLSEAMTREMHDWREAGFVIRKNGIPIEKIDTYLRETEALSETPDSGLLVVNQAGAHPVPYAARTLRNLESSRLVDDYVLNDAARDVLFDPAITSFLQTVLEAEPLLTQTLRFDRGSEQPLHMDTAFVRMNSPMKFVGVWVALEDITPDSGELIYLPGSHRWQGPLFSDRFLHWDQSRDGWDQLENWHRWIREEGERRGVPVQRFSAKKGDVLFWHSGLAHGGAPIENPDATRRSLVGHYCPTSVRPLYHYYNPKSRRVYGPPGRRYSSRYYSSKIAKHGAKI